MVNSISIWSLFNFTLFYCVNYKAGGTRALVTSVVAYDGHTATKTHRRHAVLVPSVTELNYVVMVVGNESQQRSCTAGSRQFVNEGWFRIISCWIQRHSVFPYTIKSNREVAFFRDYWYKRDIEAITAQQHHQFHLWK